MKLLLLLVATLVLCKIVSAQEDDEDDDEFFIDKEGDLILGGLFPLHLRGNNENTCGRFESMPGYHLLQSMLYAIDVINNDTKILPNITLGAKIYDSCHSQVIGARMTKKLITLTLVPPDSGQLVGVIGADSSDLSKVVADFLRVFEIPQISYGATATALSDKTVYSYFFRTVPPDTEQAKAMADIVVKLGWNYVIAINSAGLYGEKGMENFLEAAVTRGICIAKRYMLPSFSSEEYFDDFVTKKLNNAENPRAVVMFAHLGDVRKILEALKRNNIKKPFYWVASDGWGNNLNGAENFKSFAKGAITITQLDSPVKGFSEYFRALNVYNSKNSNNSWLQGFWESHFHCKLPGSSAKFARNCSGDERLASRQFEFAPVQTVVNAVYAMAHALHNYVEALCNLSDCRQFDIDRTILLRYLQNVSFNEQVTSTGKMLNFDKHQEISRGYSIFNFQENNGSYVHRPVGIWNGTLELDLSNLSWSLDGNSTPGSLCSDACEPGHYRGRKGSHNMTCCWKCEKCELFEIVVDNACSVCPFGEVPNTNQTRCMTLPTLDALTRGASQGLVAISILGLIFVIIAAVIFFKHSSVPLIKASSRELSGIILLGLSLLFIFPWLLVVKPTSTICVCQPVILGVALASCYAPLFMKILRIYRIFKSARKSAGKPILISPTSQVLIAVALITIQLLFSLISFFPTPPEPVAREIDNGEKLFFECSLGKDVFATLLSYNMFLMILCTIMAFKTRKFPRNFNEAKYIGFTMYFTCFVWIIFFPSYLSSGNGLGRIIWESSAVILIGWITLIGLFGPKICHLVMGSHLSNTSDQLAVTNNTVSQAAVVQVSNNTESTMEAQAKHEEVKENVGTDDVVPNEEQLKVDNTNKVQRKAEGTSEDEGDTTSC